MVGGMGWCRNKANDQTTTAVNKVPGKNFVQQQEYYEAHPVSLFLLVT